MEFEEKRRILLDHSRRRYFTLAGLVEQWQSAGLSDQIIFQPVAEATFMIGFPVVLTEDLRVARQQSAPAEPPRLPAERSIPILEEQIRQSEQIAREGYGSSSRDEWIHTCGGALKAAFGSGDALLQSFGTAQCGAYSPSDTQEYLEQQAQGQLSAMVSVLKSAVAQLRWRLPDPSQVFLPAGSQHDAYREIRSIIQLGVVEAFVVDSYVDETLWLLLTNVPQTVGIRVLTENMKGDFALEGKKFCAQHQVSVEVRRAKNYHDRFIIVDGKRCFHLGASIKDAGNKACVISEIERPQLARGIIADAESEWRTATPVPL